MKCAIKFITNIDGTSRALTQANVTYENKQEAEKAMQKLYMDNDLNPSAALDI